MQSTAAASPLIHLSFHDRREKLPRRRTPLAKSIAHKFSSRPKVTPALAFDPRRQSGAKQAAGRSQGSIDKFIPTLSPPRIASLLCLPPPPIGSESSGAVTFSRHQLAVILLRSSPASRRLILTARPHPRTSTPGKKRLAAAGARRREEARAQPQRIFEAGSVRRPDVTRCVRAGRN